MNLERKLNRTNYEKRLEYIENSFSYININYSFKNNENLNHYINQINNLYNIIKKKPIHSIINYMRLKKTFKVYNEEISTIITKNMNKNYNPDVIQKIDIYRNKVANIISLMSILNKKQKTDPIKMEYYFESFEESRNELSKYFNINKKENIYKLNKYINNTKL